MALRRVLAPIFAAESWPARWPWGLLFGWFFSPGRSSLGGVRRGVLEDCFFQRTGGQRWCRRRRAPIIDGSGALSLAVGAEEAGDRAAADGSAPRARSDFCRRILAGSVALGSLVWVVFFTSSVAQKLALNQLLDQMDNPTTYLWILDLEESPGQGNAFRRRRELLNYG
jgi:hypothetical protein